MPLSAMLINPYPIGFWGTPFIKCDPRIHIVPLHLCLCVECVSKSQKLHNEQSQTHRNTLQYIVNNWQGWYRTAFMNAYRPRTRTIRY